MMINLHKICISCSNNNLVGLHLCTMFHKKDLFLLFHNSLLLMINLYKICSSCSWRNTNSKYCNKIWQL